MESSTIKGEHHKVCLVKIWRLQVHVGKSIINPVAALEGNCVKCRVLTRNQNNKSNSKSYPSSDRQCHLSAMVNRF